MIEGWTSKPLGQIVTFQRGFDLPKRLRVQGDVPIISSSGPEGWHNETIKTGAGLVTGRYGTIGKVFFVEGPYWPLNTTLFVSNFHGNDPNFCYYLLQRFDFAGQSGKTGVPGVNRNDLHVIDVLSPDDPVEQKAIAAALSDADGLVVGLERVIAKKRLIKQGAMQDLLTARRRLPGFSGEWPIRTAASFAPFITSGSRGWAKYYAEAGDLFIRITNLDRESIYPDLSDRQHVALPECEREGLRTGLRSGDILISITADIGIIGYVDERVPLPAYVNQHVACLRLPSDHVCPKFVAYYLASDGPQKRFVEMTDVGAKTGINLATVSELTFACPSIHEQKAIAAVLSDMDAEIQTLESRLAKARAVKEGMMQNLLTGRVRLV